jgi:hypothetical protein
MHSSLLISWSLIEGYLSVYQDGTLVTDAPGPAPGFGLFVSAATMLPVKLKSLEFKRGLCWFLFARRFVVSG